MRVLDLPAVLRAAGCAVVEVSGWRTRGRELTALRGGVVHHTATSATARGDYPTLALVRDGRVGIPGPLSQLGLGRSGVWYVIASGRANHAGVVHSRFATTHSNEYALGVEAEHPGRGAWPRVQYDSYVRGCAALSRAYGITWYGHKEVAAPAGRKVDPTFDMGLFRAAVTASRASLPGSTPGTIPTVPDLTLPDPLEEDDMPYSPEEIKGLLKSAISEYDLETAEQTTTYGKVARANRNAAVRVDAHHILTGAQDRSSATFRAIAGAIGALTHTTPSEIVRDLDDDALNALAAQIAALPAAIADEQARRLAQ